MTSLSEPWPRTLTEPMYLFSGLPQELMIIGSDYFLSQPYQSAFPCQLFLAWNHTARRVVKLLVSFQFPTSPLYQELDVMASCHSNSYGNLYSPNQPVKWNCPIWPLMFKLPTVALETFLYLLFNDQIYVDLIYFTFPSMIPTMQWSNQTFSYLTTHRNWQKQTTHPTFLSCPKTILKWSAETMWYIGMYNPEGTVFLDSFST